MNLCNVYLFNTRLGKEIILLNIILLAFYNILYLVSNEINFSLGDEYAIVITAIYGNREKTLKPTIKQTYPTRYYAFVENSTTPSNGDWFVDSTHYQFLKKSMSLLDDCHMLNSLCNNIHPYNQYKYYKMQFYRIPSLQNARYIVWLDSSFRINTKNTVKQLIKILKKQKCSLLLFPHPSQKNIKEETDISAKDLRWNNDTLWGIKQPFQDVKKQLLSYQQDGYNIYENNMWASGAFVIDMHHSKSREFLDLWYLQNLQFSTQCQIALPYVCWKTHIKPYTLNVNIYHNKYIFYYGHDV